MPTSKRRSHGQRRCLRCFVPVQRLKIIAHKLLIETRWTDTDAVFISGPVARRVRSQYFVYQDQFIIFVNTKLELGISDDNAAFARVVRRQPVNLDTFIPDLSCLFFTNFGDDVGKVDIDIMITDFGDFTD